jgi:PAS domain S-box-containing protein
LNFIFIRLQFMNRSGKKSSSYSSTMDNKQEPSASPHEDPSHAFAHKEELDTVAQLIAYVCQTPMAMVNFLHQNQQVTRGQYGIAHHVPAHQCIFCQHTTRQSAVFEIEDTALDKRFATSAQTLYEQPIRFYAGAPLLAPDGTAIGALCVVDTKPRKLSAEQKSILKILADAVMLNMQLNFKKQELEKEKTRLQASEIRYRSLYELSQGLIGEHDLDGNILSANMASARSLETTIEALIGKNMRTLLAPHSNDLFDEYLSELREKGRAEGLMHVLTSSGQSRYWMYNNIYIRDTEKPYVLCSSQDVTELVLTKKELKRAQKLSEQSMAVKQQFLASVTHEIRTPMNAIVGFGKLLQRTEISEKQKKYLDAINTSGENLLLIVNDLLDSAKIEAGKMTFEKIPFSLQDVLSSVLTILHYKASEKDIILSAKTDPDVPPYLTGDPTRLNQILTNLAGNAVKFTEKGTVEIHISQKESDTSGILLQIQVSDTGIGIEPDKLPFIFDSFSQAGYDTTRKYGGTGLGLTIVRQLTELQGGTIEVVSPPGKGTTFTVMLPYTIATEVPTLLSQKDENADTLRLHQVRILLAEDNHLNHLLLGYIMSEWGAEMSIAENGQKAIDMLRTNTYDLILMDVHMPDMDGYEACHYIRHQMPSPLCLIPIIAITANASDEERKKCMDAGMDDFIAKPFQSGDLYQKIAKFTTLSPDKPRLPLHAKRAGKNEHKKRIIRLGYLKSIASGNRKFLKEIMEVFVNQVPEQLLSLEHALNERNWPVLGDAAHKMKLGVNVMGMKEAEKNLIFIETEAREKIVPDENAIKNRIEKLKDKCMLAVEEVKTLMKEWKL